MANVEPDIEYCPSCGSTYFQMTKDSNYIYECECGAKFEVNFYNDD